MNVLKKIFFSGSNNQIAEMGRTMTNIESNQPQKLPYPKRVFFIISNEFCERFTFYGLRSN